MKGKILSVAVLISIFTMILGGCWTGGQKTKIVGKWEGYDGTKDSVVSYYEFSKDNEVTIDVHYNWDVVWDRFHYTYTLNNGKMYFTNGSRFMEGDYIPVEDQKPISFRFEGDTLILDEYWLKKVETFSETNPI
jgi:hypothetical protein